MEVKSNVKQRRLDRMKQLSEVHQPYSPSRIRNREEPPYMGVPTHSLNEPAHAPNLEASPLDERWQDPEYVWNQRDRFRSEKALNWAPGENRNRLTTPMSPPDYRTRAWLSPPTSRQLWVKFGMAAVIFVLAYGTFRIDHPLALKGRQWVTSALTKDYDFSAAAAWYEAKFSGLPAVLPASWRRADPEAQKATAANARQMYAPVAGRILTPYTVADPVIALEAPSGEAKAMDAGRVLAVTTGTDNQLQVVIQHADGLQSTYGGLGQTPLKKFDWIKGGEIVGQVATGTGNRAGRLLFAVKKDNQWIDPADVVPLD